MGGEGGREKGGGQINNASDRTCSNFGLDDQGKKAEEINEKSSRSCVWKSAASLLAHQCWFVTGKLLVLAEIGEHDALVRGGGLEKVGLGKMNWLCAVHGAEWDCP